MRTVNDWHPQLSCLESSCCSHGQDNNYASNWSTSKKLTLDRIGTQFRCSAAAYLLIKNKSGQNYGIITSLVVSFYIHNDTDEKSRGQRFLIDQQSMVLCIALVGRLLIS